MPRDYLDNVRICEYCGKEMVGVGSRRKYCDLKCERAYRKGMPDAKIVKCDFSSVDSKNCEDCHYWRQISASCRGCHYLLITGKKRPCPPGSGCTVKVKTRVYRKKVKHE